MLIASANECINKNCLVDCNQNKKRVANLYHDTTHLVSVQIEYNKFLKSIANKNDTATGKA